MLQHRHSQSVSGYTSRNPTHPSIPVSLEHSLLILIGPVLSIFCHNYEPVFLKDSTYYASSIPPLLSILSGLKKNILVDPYSIQLLYVVCCCWLSRDSCQSQRGMFSKDDPVYRSYPFLCLVRHDLLRILLVLVPLQSRLLDLLCLLGLLHDLP